MRDICSGKTLEFSKKSAVRDRPVKVIEKVCLTKNVVRT